MKNILAWTFGLLVASAMVSSLSAKGATTKVVISGADLIAPVEIADAAMLGPFNVWAGPGTTSCIRGVCTEGAEGFIIDWPSGVVTQRPIGLQRYIVSFFTESNRPVSVTTETPAEQPTYVVWYEYDPAAHRGYVYLPGKDDQWYQTNVKAIFRQREGSWFLATSAWDTFARLLIERSAY